MASSLDSQTNAALDHRDLEWVRIWYQNAHSDIRWSKEQAWRALQATVILFSGIVAASHQVLTVPAWSFKTLIVLGAGVAVFYLVDLHRMAKKSREWCDQLVADSGWTRPQPRRIFDPDHVTYLLVRIIIVVAALVLAWLSVNVRVQGPP